jgi:hypothetical protein
MGAALGFSFGVYFFITLPNDAVSIGAYYSDNKKKAKGTVE